MRRTISKVLSYIACKVGLHKYNHVRTDSFGNGELWSEYSFTFQCQRDNCHRHKSLTQAEIVLEGKGRLLSKLIKWDINTQT